MTYKVELDVYNGPMDLLLYLIRREEVEITELPVARIADQYIAYLDVLESLDIELAGDFVVMAATLLELKSRALLPRVPEIEDEDGEDAEDPRETLIRQLIEYRRYKGAAAHLDDRGRDMARRFPRQFDDDLLHELERESADEEPAEDILQGIEVWDLISAFSNVIRTLGYSKPREVIYDDMPVERVAQDLIARLEREKSILFTQLFDGGRTLNHLITTFLAILELVRQRRIGAEQTKDFADMRVFLRDPSAEEPVKQVRPRGARESRDALKRKRPRRPSARQLDNLRDTMEDVEFEKTEFDEILDSIHVPDVTVRLPSHAHDEPAGPPEADRDGALAEEEAAGPETAEANGDEALSEDDAAEPGIVVAEADEASATETETDEDPLAETTPAEPADGPVDHPADSPASRREDDGLPPG